MSSLRHLFLFPPRLTLAVAESLTSGHVQVLAGARSGASDFFLGGITAYTLDQKVRHLGVDRAEAQRVDSVSASVAEQMARGVRQLFGSDVGLATTGWAEPSPGKGVKVPFAWWAVAWRQADGAVAVKSGRVEMTSDNSRMEVQAGIAEMAVIELIKLIGELRSVHR